MNLRDYGYRYVQIEINNTCNMACTFCPLPIRVSPNEVIDKNQVFKILDELSNYQGIDFVAFHHFGEPLLNKNLWEYIDYAHSLKFKTHLVTNGLLLKKSNVDRIIKHSPTFLKISAQIINDEHHEEVRGIKMNAAQYIDQVTTCIARLNNEIHSIEEIRTDLAVSVKFTGINLIKEKLKQKLGAAELEDPSIYHPTLKKLRPHLINFLKMVESKTQNFKFSETKLDENIDKYNYINFKQKLFETLYEINEKNLLTGKKFWNGRKMSQYYPVQSAKCGTEILGVLSNGSVVMCCLDYQGETTLGNIFDNSLESILYKNKQVIDGLRIGTLHFDGCKRCLGSPTKYGAKIKNVKNILTKLISQSRIL